MNKIYNSLERISQSNRLFISYSSRDNMLPTHIKLSSSLTCRLVGGLAREQRTVCHDSPDTVSIAFEGLQLAVKECQHQFRWHRWNCSSLLIKSSNPHSSSIMKRGKCFFDVSFYNSAGISKILNILHLKTQLLVKILNLM